MSCGVPATASSTSPAEDTKDGTYPSSLLTSDHFEVEVSKHGEDVLRIAS